MFVIGEVIRVICKQEVRFEKLKVLPYQVLIHDEKGIVSNFMKYANS